MAEPCRFCGSTRFGHTNATLNGSRVPACCWDCALCAQHMPALGHAIARFVRRAEVAGLVERARWCAIRLSRLNADSDIGREAQSDHDAAVLALARLAGGEA